MLRGQHCVRPHSIVIIHRLSGYFLSGGVFVLIEPQEVVNLLIWLVTLKDSGIKILRRLQVLERSLRAHRANMRLSGRQRSLDLPISLAIELVSPNEQAS